MEGSMENLKCYAMINGQYAMGRPEPMMYDNIVTLYSPCMFAPQLNPNGQVSLTMMDLIPMSSDDKVQLNLGVIAFTFTPNEQLKKHYEETIKKVKAAKAGLILP
jgi:hypothetical protein